MKKYIVLSMMIFMSSTVAFCQDEEDFVIPENTETVIGAFHVYNPLSYYPGELDSVPVIKDKIQRESLINRLKSVDLKKYGLSKIRTVFAFLINEEGIVKNLHIYESEVALKESDRKNILKLIEDKDVPGRHYAIIKGRKDRIVFNERDDMESLINEILKIGKGYRWIPGDKDYEAVKSFVFF